MANDSLCFDIGSEISIEGTAFIVEGYIVFEDNYGSSWTEYKIKSKDEFLVKWLSIDRENDEYAVYMQRSYDSDFVEENIIAKGYKKVDDSSAKVVDYSGSVDVDLQETVYYKEYEDDTEELLLSIEEWDGEIEYSKGYYICREDIENLSYAFVGSSNGSQPYNRENSYEVNNHRKKMTNGVRAIICIIFIIFIMKACSSGNVSASSPLSEFVKADSNFRYVTSITSDLDNSKKADVYSTNKTVEETTKLIIEGLHGKIDDVQENFNDGTVVLAAADELGLIYTSEDRQTLIQISKRDYVYSSRNTPYRASHITNSYYRNYYYGRLYNEDRNKYSNAPSGYSDYSGGTFTPNNNKYKDYSDSIRQDSTKSRPSSGGGTSFGK